MSVSHVVLHGNVRGLLDKFWMFWIHVLQACKPCTPDASCKPGSPGPPVIACTESIVLTPVHQWHHVHHMHMHRINASIYTYHPRC